MNIKKLCIAIIMSVFGLLQPIQTWAQEYRVSYNEASIDEVISDLRNKTGYEFVYQKQILNNVGPISCTYNSLTINQLLDRIFWDKAGLDYEIVEKNIILSIPTKELEYFKKVITGMVTDENDNPLPGASILFVGSNTGVTTDTDGQFVLTVEGKDPVIRISFIGMKEQMIHVNSLKENFLLVKMQNDERMMEEVVVTGYQNIKRENATGSYQSVKSKDLGNRYTSSIAANLEGKIPGLVSYNNGLGDDQESSLIIRGVGSFQANTSPLVVVDGLPIEGSIESVNPYEIESITVLKDAAAAAIYGARASNGVIVITTKRAQSEKLTIDFNTDITISEKRDYDNFRWANASELIELEKYNYNYIRNAEDQSAFSTLLQYYENRRKALSPVSRLLVANYLGELGTDELNSTLERLSKNDYRKEWQDATERSQVLKQYNLALRTKGKVLGSSIVLNYKTDNNGIVNQHNNMLTFSYKGDLDVTKWLDLSLGTNIIRERAKTHISRVYGYNRINAFQPYQSMYNEDGTRAAMEADVYLGEESLNNPAYGFKSVSYNLLDELNKNFQKTSRTNIRSFLHANVKILPEWTVSSQFQYEDINYKNDAYYEGDSYYMRHLYNLYTTEEVVQEEDWDTGEMISSSVVKHHIPAGGRFDTDLSEGAFYTFRAQSNYSKTFADKHELIAIAGYEFRESKSKTYKNLLMGYDEQTQTNSNGLVNYGVWKDLEGQVSALGDNYTIYGAPDGNDFLTTNILHRFYSVYFTGNYSYDNRYSASFSYRVDKTDLFGADPKFRGRPLWSTGLSWNINNEEFMKNYKWVDVLKLRGSYGLTGNIDKDISSYLTATIGVNEVTGAKYADLDTPPNDQLRWEKTASWNIGLDFSLWRNRLSGSIDGYRKTGTDILTITDLDPTTGWSQLTINSGEALNTGVEIQLNGSIIKPSSYNSIGVNASVNFAYNKNEVTKVSHQPSSGAEALRIGTLHEGYPVNSLFSYRFAGLLSEDNIQHFRWEDANGQIHSSDINSGEFTPEDAVFSGGLDPKYMASFNPEITYGGFSITAMLSYYGGHYMRVLTDDWSSEGSTYGYSSLASVDAIPSSYLNYWRSDDKNLYPANGYLGGSNVIGDYRYLDTNVVSADYVKLRTLVLAYSFSQQFSKKIGVNNLRLRFQVNNLATWQRNKLGIDPEANNPAYGTTLPETPRSYTMSLNFNL
nr:SusC/RagA family TonB-linked outer membrane protein [uncultured Draconibacterium sp.]